MKILVTGSAGHLGEALMRTLKDSDHEATGLDIKRSPFTRREGSITDRSFVKQCMQSVDVVVHEYRRRAWSMMPAIDRAYVNELARARLGWQPRYDFGCIIYRLHASEDFRSPLARSVGSKGYH
jgi:UDP-glucose 4-epimerase